MSSEQGAPLNPQEPRAEAPAPAQRRLRVAVLNRMFTATGGGAENYSIRLVEQMADRHEMHVFAQEVAHDWPGVTYHRVPLPMRRPRWLNQLWFALYTAWHTRRGFDVVHSHENTWQGRVQTIHVKPVRFNLLAGRSGWPLALRWLKIATSPRLLTYVLLEAARFQVRPGQQVVLASASLQADAAQVYPAAVPQMSVITPGVQMPGAGWSRAEVRRALGLAHDGPLLLFVANDYARKGLGTLLDALAQLPADVALAVVGNPSQIAVFRERAGALGIAQRVHFLGAMNEVAPVYRAADVLVHPTLEDTFAMVVLEAMAYGLPVVVSGPAHCGISALLRDEQDALLLADPRDAAGLAAALSRLLSEPPLQASLSRQALSFAQAHGWDEAARAYERLYLASLT